MNWAQDKLNGIFVTASRMDTDSNDFVAGFNLAATRDGQAVITGNWNFGTFKIGNYGAAVARNDVPNFGQLQDALAAYGATVGGTANAITVTLAPAITAYAAGAIYSFIAGASNTGATTINFNGVGVVNVTRLDKTALQQGDILSGMLTRVQYDGTEFQLLDKFAILDSVPLPLSSVAGTNTITGTSGYPLNAYAQGQMFLFKAAGANTGAATLNVNSLGAKNIVTGSGAALSAGNIASGQMVIVIYDGTAMQILNAVTSGRIINVQTFTSSGMYTPTTGTNSAIVEMIAGGGGGGAASSTGANQNAAGGGGAMGQYQRFRWTSPTMQNVTIGAAGTNGAGAGGTGGSTVLGTIATCVGGGGGGFQSTPQSSATPMAAGGTGGAGGTQGPGSILNLTGGNGGMGVSLAANGALTQGGSGANSPLGSGGVAIYIGTATQQAGAAATGFGSGGGGGANTPSIGTNANGGAATPGIVIIYEYS